ESPEAVDGRLLEAERGVSDDGVPETDGGGSREAPSGEVHARLRRGRGRRDEEEREDGVDRGEQAVSHGASPWPARGLEASPPPAAPPRGPLRTSAHPRAGALDPARPPSYPRAPSCRPTPATARPPRRRRSRDPRAPSRRSRSGSSRSPFPSSSRSPSPRTRRARGRTGRRGRRSSSSARSSGPGGAAGWGGPGRADSP